VRAAGVLASPSRDPARPNRVYRAIQRVLVSVSSFACLQARHRAPLLAEEELGLARERRVSTHSSNSSISEMDAAAHSSRSRLDPRSGWPSRHSPHGEGRCVRQTRRGSALVVVRTPGGSQRTRRARSPRPSHEGRQSHRARKPGDELLPYHRVRGAWSRVTSPLHARERALSVPGSRRSDPYRTHGPAPKPPQ
jgi:hypothetical protein